MTRTTTKLVALAVLLGGFALALSVTRATPPVNARTACTVDGDCEVARRLPTCSPCGNCPSAPFAVASRYVRDLEAQRRACARTPSASPMSCAPCPARPASDARPLRAVCVQSACALREASTPPAP